MDSKAQIQSYFFKFNPPNPPNHPTPYPPDPLQNTNFANFGPIWMKIGVDDINGEQSSKQEIFLIQPSQPTYPLPPH